MVGGRKEEGEGKELRLCGRKKGDGEGGVGA